jgi:hypothetical protein
MSLLTWNELVAFVNDRTTLGQEGVRDPEHPCDAFCPGRPAGSCATDGHYLCDECTERDTCEDGCGKRSIACECPPAPGRP